MMMHSVNDWDPSLSCHALRVVVEGRREHVQRHPHAATRSPKDCRTEDEAAIRERDDDVLHVGWDPSFP